jgi:DNA-binding transcriptional MocR family regulator
MEISVDRTSGVPIYLQIARQIREMILGGALPAGFRLPPERRLATALGVNRSTVLAAYRELKTTELLGAHVGRGTEVVAHRYPGKSAAGVPALAWRQLLSESAVSGEDPLLRDLLAMTERRDVIPLSIGMPAPDLLPLDALRIACDEVLGDGGPEAFLHCPTEGHTPLRESLAALMATRGISCATGEVVVLSGSQQGLDLAARVFLDPGDAVVVEEPSFFGALQVFRAAQARLLGVPVDENGMRTDVLEEILSRHRPKLIYTLPTFQNPSGAVLSLSRRKHLLELAYRFGVPILEDDPYSELRYDGEPLPSLKAIDEGDHVIYLSTFSKVLFPGLRLGWLAAPRAVVRRLVLAKGTIDLHSNTFGQFLLDRFLRDGHYAPHVHNLRRAYAARRDAMEEALRAGAPDGMTWRHPQGGFYLWCSLPENVKDPALLARAAEAGVSYLPGRACFTEPPAAAFVRLVFSFARPRMIARGIARLLEAVRQAGSARRPEGMGASETRPIV